MSEWILLVDDEPDMLALLSQIIEGKTTYKTHAISDPREVAGLLRKWNYSLVMTDMRMPQQSGLDLLSTIKGIDPQLRGGHEKRGL